MGALASWDHQRNRLILFGGQKSDDKFSVSKVERLIMNDVVMFDVQEMKVVDHLLFSESGLARRMYHCGFMLDDSLFSIGGLSTAGKTLDEFIEVNTLTRKFHPALVHEGRELLSRVSQAAITPVFYQSKMSDDGGLSLGSLAGDINWGEALELIKHEGFYMFGGLRGDGFVTNQLLVFKVRYDKIKGRAAFKIIEPPTVGTPPDPRCMHTINYAPKLSLAVVYGGRNDAKVSGPVLDDIWVLKLYNLEWVRVQVGGVEIPRPRCNHTAFMNETQLIVCGG